jgi:hypothetical protein
VILTVLQRLDARVHRRRKTLQIYVELDHGAPFGSFVRDVRKLDYEIYDIQYEPDGGLEDGTRAFLASIKSRTAQDHLIISSQLKKLPGVVHVEEL